MDEFARLPSEDRIAAINEAAARRDVTPVIIEKDFWVCWTLKRLSECTGVFPHITFKGGTSLSKAYGIIERFSEDIDLTIARNAPLLADVSSPMDADISNKERARRIDALKGAAQTFVHDHIRPQLESAIAGAIGTNDGWELVADPDDREGQTLLFNYPRLANYGTGYGRGGFGVGRYGEGEIGYIKPRIKLEFGARGDTDPSETRTLTPYLAQEFPDLLPNPEISFPTLAVERTFWEKVTILHALFYNHRVRDGMSRHYYDTYMLMHRGVADKAITMPDLLGQVVHNKSLMFADNKASYDTAKIGTLRLVPSDVIRATLQSDYAAMQEMFMADVPDFDALMDEIAVLESKLNER